MQVLTVLSCVLCPSDRHSHRTDTYYSYSPRAGGRCPANFPFLSVPPSFQYMFFGYNITSPHLTSGIWCHEP